MQQINEVESLPIFIKLDKLSNFRKDNLLENNIPFLLVDKMAFLPFMATFLTNNQYQTHITNNKLTISINATINMYKNDHIKMYKINST